MSHILSFSDRYLEVQLFAVYERLIGDTNFDGTIGIHQYTLAAQAGVDAGVTRAVYEVFFAVIDLRHKFFSLLQVYMTSAASANHTTIVVQFNVIVQRHLKDTLIGRHIFDRHGFKPLLIKTKFYSVHELFESSMQK